MNNTAGKHQALPEEMLLNQKASIFYSVPVHFLPK